MATPILFSLPDDALDHPSSRQQLADMTARRLGHGLAAGGSVLREAQRDTIVEHIWLARAIARRYRNRGEDEEDLVQVACAGLVEAVLRFVPERGDFLAFAGPTITGVLKRHFRDHGWLIRPSRKTQELVIGMRREWSGLTQELGHAPDTGQLARRLGASVAEITESTKASQGYRSMSMDALVENHPRLVPADSADFERVETRLTVDKAVDQLDDRDRRLVWMRFYQQRSQSDIAAELGTSQMQISRRLTQVLGRLRAIVGADQQARAS